jgi:predicted DCC family thiol-disulfide oxidoreductase YuxK
MRSDTVTPRTPDARPVLIYDGDCAFCVHWVRYWQRLTGANVSYAPYQQVGARYPQITTSEFGRAAQYVAPDGHIAAGAEAAFRTLAHAPGKAWWLALYRRLPGFAWLCERVYALVAAHRGIAYRATLLLWGRDAMPPRFELTARLFIGGLALVCLAAFVSLGVQIGGLVGSDGILPARDYLAAVAQRFGVERYWLFPTLFWFDAGDRTLQAACVAGAVASALLLLRVAPRVNLALLFVLYLSLFYAGQTFMSFQWDLLLLESGFLAFALFGRPALLVWIARWLVFRFMFMSGVVKLLGDPAWLDFTALRYHFQTQPLPTPLAWYAARLPDGALLSGAAATLAIELVLPFFILLPRRLRFVAAWAFIGLQCAIVLSGNYGFFNGLAIVLCLTLFDDAAIRRVLPRRLRGALSFESASVQSSLGWSRRLAPAYAAFSLFFGGLQLVETWRAPGLPDATERLVDAIAPLRIVNRYGPFKAMTRERPEIVIEGSRDGEHWREYAFRYKPGDVRRRPGWNLAHQPRLDWQMWFAAMQTERENPWFARLLRGLLRNSPPVVALLAENPFADAPPLEVRALLYDYRFADAARHEAGQWWTREPAGVYFPAVRLSGDGTGLSPVEQLHFER